MFKSTRHTHPITLLIAALLCVGLSPASVVSATAQYEVETVISAVRSHSNLDRPAPLPPVTVAPAGDSITAWTQILDGTPISTTWPSFLGEGIEVVPGFAAGGYKIGAIAASTPYCGCDVVVVMAGTNDMGTERWATPMGERAESLVQIVVASGAAHALILATPPRDDGGVWVTEWNVEQARLAAFYGWDYFDPWASIRTAGDGFVPGTAKDYAHPTVEAQAAAGALIRDAILDVVR